MDIEHKSLKMELHEIMIIPGASLWELCRSFDADNGEHPDVAFPGLSLYSYFKKVMETREVANPVTSSKEKAVELVFVVDGFVETARRGLEDEACSEGGGVTI